MSESRGRTGPFQSCRRIPASRHSPYKFMPSNESATPTHDHVNGRGRHRCPTASRPSRASGKPLDLFEYFVRNRHRGFHTKSITSLKGQEAPRFCGQIVDNGRARLCRHPRKHACFCFRPIPAADASYAVLVQPNTAALNRSFAMRRSRVRSSTVHQPSLSIHAKVARRSAKAGCPCWSELRLAGPPSLRYQARIAGGAQAKKLRKRQGSPARSKLRNRRAPETVWNAFDADSLAGRAPGGVVVADFSAVVTAEYPRNHDAFPTLGLRHELPLSFEDFSHPRDSLRVMLLLARRGRSSRVDAGERRLVPEDGVEPSRGVNPTGF